MARLGLLDRLSKAGEAGSTNRTLVEVPTARDNCPDGLTFGAGDCLDARVTAAGHYLVQVAGPPDADAIRQFVCGLSVQTQYLRFFTAVAPPSRGLLRALTGGSPRADILIATDELGRVIGHGMAVDPRLDRPSPADTVVADIGLVVADRWQGQGVGTALLRVLVERAARRGVQALQLEVLPGNTRMLGIIDRRWPDAERKRIPDAISITARIAPPADVLSAGAYLLANRKASHDPRQSAA